ncbi:MAG: protein-L-isoaspartate(D-aspartate) O-methyltransferase [Candidatus Omnitrophica bacterium]|nr:protein-L-isoaspartate(D-aspartate) O-methyltransferase [Candidatus Omnitrophota bacterium]
MVQLQIQRRGVSDERVLDAMLKVERHLFVPRTFAAFAYLDQPLPIGKGQTISQPYIVALMTELAKVKPDDKVLEIGTGSGYQAAVLAELSNQVYTIELIPELAARAETLLNNLGYTNIKVKQGDGYLGWPEYAPFDIIIVTCAPIGIPDKLIEQLSEEGRIVIPVGEEGNQVLKLLLKESGEIIEKDVVPVRFVPMVHE